MTSLKKAQLLKFLLILSILLPSSAGRDTLTPAEPLIDGQTLVSPGQTFELGFFSPAGSDDRYVGIWYHKVSVQTVVWVANRRRPVKDRLGCLSINVTGGLLITDQNSTVFWSSSSDRGLADIADPVAQLLDSGNFVVKEAGSNGDDAPRSFVWQSFDFPTDTLLPGMKFGRNLTSGLDRNLTPWTSSSDPSPSRYTAAMDVSGSPQIVLWAGSRLSWRSGPWNGRTMSGIPEMSTYSMFSFEFIADADEVYYMYKTRDPSFISRIVVDLSGTPQRLVWIEERKMWNAFWYALSDECDGASPCGPNGVCNAQDLLICDCLQGFQPKDPKNWAMRVWSGGCMRKSALGCRTGGFMAVSGAKLPDTSRSWVDMRLSLDQCRAKCLTKCACTAYASANISSGIGCIIWTTELIGLRVYIRGGQDLYVRVAAADLASKVVHKQSRKKRVMIVVILCIACGTLIFALVAYYTWKKVNRTKGMSNRNMCESSKGDEEFELPLFALNTISAATNNFSSDNMLGEGGFGFVYKGKLHEGQEVAVKRLSRTSIQGLDEFKNEITLIAKLQHRNLVRILGYCLEGEERMLIYEYMPHKSLDAFLFDKHKGAYLNWETRYNIIIGIARGLLYLHQDSRLRIIHRDLKASNILLDKEMNPKISDFGLARVFGGDNSMNKTKRIVGTYGYMSPEYVIDGIFSVKSDVFSFGVLVLEIVSGQKNRAVYLSDPNLSLLGNAWYLWNEGRSLELVNPLIGDSFSRSEAMRCIKVGLLCIQELPEDRPTMSSVVTMLDSNGIIVREPKQPGFVAKRGISESNSWTEKHELDSINDVTVTLLQGRQ